jgi:signal peptidase II
MDSWYDRGRVGWARPRSASCIKGRTLFLKYLKPLSFKHFAIVAGVVIVLDQLSKWLVLATLEGEPPLVIIPNLLQFYHRTNTGAAFSMLNQYPYVLMVFASLVATLIALWAWKLRPEERPLRLPLGMIFGGAVGNLIDRYRLGHVTDFIDAHWNNVHHFPTFNVADSAICVGMGLMILMSLWEPSPAPQQAGQAQGQTQKS